MTNSSLDLRCDATFEMIERHLRHIRWMLALVYFFRLATFIVLR
jgi:hypothetical protein